LYNKTLKNFENFKKIKTKKFCQKTSFFPALFHLFLKLAGRRSMER